MSYIYIYSQKHTPRVAVGITYQQIMWHDDVDKKMFMYLANMDITIACASGF